MELAGGAIIFLVFLVVFTFAVIMSLFTRRGSGINHHAYRNVYGGAPGADQPCEDFGGADRTFLNEQRVLRRWQPLDPDAPRTPAPRAVASKTRMPVRSPMGGRRPC